MEAPSIFSANEFLQRLNQEPNPEHIRKNDDGSLYIPISITQSLLDELFLGMWNFRVENVVYGRKWARGNGVMECINPINGITIVRSGDAAIQLTGNMRTDSPRLEAMILLSCAKKFGKVFGRDLNRTKDDAPLPTIDISKEKEYNTEEARMKVLIDDCNTEEELNSYRLVVPASLKKYFESAMKKIKAK